MLQQLESSLQVLPQRESVYSLIHKALLVPVSDMLSRPRKGMRGDLTTIGFQMAGPTAEQRACAEQTQLLEACRDLVECLHAGSLVVDDIQDNSDTRRGGPSLHRQYGIPLALNAGNWMYFFAFEFLKSFELASHLKVQIFECVQETLLAAHYGQALDLGTQIDQLSPDQMVSVVKASLELKTGQLMALGLKLGALVGGADHQRLKILEKFGLKLGVVLQMFDDIGNLKPEKPTPKHLEDLLLRRPSFVWWFLAQPDYQNLLLEFKNAVKALPLTDQLRDFVDRHDIVAKAHAQTWILFEEILQELKQQLPSSTEFPLALTALHDMGKRLAYAY